MVRARYGGDTPAGLAYFGSPLTLLLPRADCNSQPSVRALAPARSTRARRQNCTDAEWRRDAQAIADAVLAEQPGLLSRDHGT